MPEAPREMASTLKWVLFALAGWTVLAAIPTSSAYIAEGSQGARRWFSIFSNIAPYYYLWALFTPAIYRLSTTSLNPRNGMLAAVLGHTAIVVSLSLVFGFVLHYENWRAWLIGTHAPGYYTMSAFSYIFILLGIYLYALQEKVRQQDTLIARQQRNELELESSLARAQIDALRGQMNPHFLFNALNCIGALIETGQNERAYEALEDLGALLRTSLEHRNQELVPLREELAFAKRYIAMEQVRFGERLAMDISVDSAAAQWMVPPFVLQPLIENTVKHAVAPSHDPVTIHVTARRHANGIEIQVCDDGPGSARSSESSGTGVGLENLRDRLGLIYGTQARLEFTQTPSGTRVAMQIPDHADLYLNVGPDYSDPQEDPSLADQSHQDSPIRRARGAAL